MKYKEIFSLQKGTVLYFDSNLHIDTHGPFAFFDSINNLEEGILEVLNIRGELICLQYIWFKSTLSA